MSNPYEGDSTDPLVPGIKGTNSKGDAVVGFTAAAGKSGVLGISNGAFGAGVTGTSSIAHGVHGVNGKGANNPPSVGAGLCGESDGGFGVYGASIANNGIHGDSIQGDAIVGIAHAQGKAGVLGVSDNGNGVHGKTSSNKDSAVFAEHTGQGIGVFASGAGAGVVGQSTGGPGVHGKTSSNKDSAVFAEHTGQGIGVFASGAGAGVVGQSTSGPGVHGKTSSDKDSAVFAEHTGQGIGVFGTSAKGFAGFFQGNVHVTGSQTVEVDILLTGADCAEQFDVADSQQFEPGSVMVINDTGALELSRLPYDRKVAGVISGAGDFRPGLVLDKRPRGNRVPIALLGKVYCKVDARHTAVDVGDLLTTSPTPGHAMKVDDPLKAFGAVIGKALRPLRSGQELVPILIALQ